MIRSMTGFGRAEHAAGSWRCGVEIRSVNARFLDARIKLPPGLNHMEEEMQKIVRAACERGKIDCTVFLAPLDESEGTLRINKPLARQYAALLRELRAEFHTDFEVNLSELVNTRDLVQPVSWEAQAEAVENLIRTALAAAVRELAVMREREGENLAADLVSRVAQLRAQIAEIVPLTEDLPKQYAQRIRENLARLVEGPVASEDRILQEISILADRCDVSEEITRFNAHLDHVESMLQQGGVVGRKFEFLLQELNREANTLTNKGNDAQVSARVVEIKSILEKLREQIQNIE